MSCVGGNYKATAKEEIFFTFHFCFSSCLIRKHTLGCHSLQLNGDSFQLVKLTREETLFVNYTHIIYSIITQSSEEARCINTHCVGFATPANDRVRTFNWQTVHKHEFTSCTIIIIIILLTQPSVPFVSFPPPCLLLLLLSLLVSLQLIEEAP